MHLKPVRVFIDFGEHRGSLLAAGLSNQAIFAVFAAHLGGLLGVRARPRGQPGAAEGALRRASPPPCPVSSTPATGGAIDPDDLLNTTVLGWTGAIALDRLALHGARLAGIRPRRGARLIGDLPGPPHQLLPAEAQGPRTRARIRRAAARVGRALGARRRRRSEECSTGSASTDDQVATVTARLRRPAADVRPRHRGAGRPVPGARRRAHPAAVRSRRVRCSGRRRSAC